MFDGESTNALATGETRSWRVQLSTNAQQVPFRVTLVWTDPPGNPNAAVKLVNDLDLVVSNTVTHAVYCKITFPRSAILPRRAIPIRRSPAQSAMLMYSWANRWFKPGRVVVGRRVNVNAVSDYQLATDRPRAWSGLRAGHCSGDSITNGFTAGTPVQIVSESLPAREPVSNEWPSAFQSTRGGNSRWSQHQWNHEPVELLRLHKHVHHERFFDALRNQRGVHYSRPPNISNRASGRTSTCVSSDQALLNDQASVARCRSPIAG
jgi:hypothetical protein